MERRQFIRALIAAGACPLCAKVGFAEPHWTYEGEEGPEHWGKLDPHNLACSRGMQQSPIDISGEIRAELPSLSVDWKPGRSVMVNNGHTIQVDVPEGNKLFKSQEGYELKQFHFHAPSEHRVKGETFPMEVHFVHRNPETGSFGVLGVFLRAGGNNEAFAKLSRSFPEKNGDEVVLEAFDPNGLLPPELDYWLYEGSLTTPPCSEDVDWMIARTPVDVNGEDIEKFTEIYSMNARPIRLPNRRFILSSD